MTRLVVAIDGPSGVGKSTVGREVARRLGLRYLDTGAMYRAIGLAVLRAGEPLPLADPAKVGEIARTSSVEVTGSAEDARTFLNGEDVSALIRTPEVTRYSSAVSAVPAVRRHLATEQRRLALEGGGVLEGRDIGSKVVPEAAVKVFLTASKEIRARRRWAELAARGTPQSPEAVLADLEARDRADETREDSPLVQTPDHWVVETSEEGVDGVVARILARVERMPR